MTKPTEEEKIVVDIDGNIKEAIDELFEDFIDFFFPEMSPKVNYLEKPIAIEQEFQGIIRFASGRKKIMDKLYQLTMKPVFKQGKKPRETDNQAANPIKKEIILLHTEAETSPKSNFVKRMFLYAAVAIAKHNRPITALVIYTGKNVPKKPNFFELSCYGTKLSYFFNYYAVAEQNEVDLIKNKNIFALVILAIKYVIDTPNDYAKRFAFKKKLFELLLEREYPSEKRRVLVIFIREILRLPTSLEREFITFAQQKVENSMKIKKQDNSVKARWKQAEKEWADIFSEVTYGAPVDVLLKKNTAEVTAEVTAKNLAEREKQTQGVVLHLYHTIGLSVNQIAESFNLDIDKIQSIINIDKNNI